MDLAFIHAARPGAVDDTLRSVVDALVSDGRRLAGVVPHADAPVGRHPCERDLVDLSSDRRMSIHQALGKDSTGCRLDADALEVAVAAIERDMAMRRPELLIVNRFGKLEAIGRGFCPLFARALDLGIPVLVGVNDLNRPAFDAFASGMALELPDQPRAVLRWVMPLLQGVAA